MIQEKYRTNIPVAIFLWKRPESTKQILGKILDYKPKKLLVVIDGPRNELDNEQIDAVKDIVRKYQESTDIPFFINAAEKNLGTMVRFQTAFDWIFENTEEVIILEDDTIPGKSFFFFCEHYLNKFRLDKEVIAINGSCRVSESEISRLGISGPFMNNIFCAWGWATWKDKFLNTFKQYDHDLSFKEKLSALFTLKNIHLFKSRYSVLQRILKGEIDLWDVQLQWNIITNNKRVITTHANLITNIGLDSEAATQLRDWHNHLFRQIVEVDCKSSKSDDIRYVPEYDIICYNCNFFLHYIILSLYKKSKKIVKSTIYTFKKRNV